MHCPLDDKTVEDIEEALSAALAGEEAVEIWVRLGAFYTSSESKNTAKAVRLFDNGGEGVKHIKRRAIP